LRVLRDNFSDFLLILVPIRMPGGGTIRSKCNRVGMHSQILFLKSNRASVV
jgi:hypothetical protein